jgi:Ca2+-binding RTX toxin-like protein
MRKVVLPLLVMTALSGLASAATITGTPRADRLTGTPRADRIDGGAGADTLRGLGGADLLIGGPGRDTIDAGRGDDSIQAYGDGSRDVVRCGPGRDVVTADRSDVVASDCEVVSRQISADTTTGTIGQHATEVEPDSFAFGSTVVSVFQMGRVSTGGAEVIGFSTSRDGGATWASGRLPGVTRSSPQPGVAERASDPAVAYDAVHGVWLSVTLGIAPAVSSFFLYANRSADGLSWSAPVAAVTAPADELDKEWVTCDNGAASPFKGHCYISYLSVPSGLIRTTTSIDGGLTWSTPVTSSPPPASEFDANGAQPVTLPDGTLVVVYTSFADPRFNNRSQVVAVRSTDGGATFSAPARVGSFMLSTVPSVRTFALPSVEVDGSGRIYAAWEGCLAVGPCDTARILLSSSPDGVTWSAPVAVTPASTTSQHFLPGLGADPASTGRLTLVYHSIPVGCANEQSCPGITILQTRSADGGHTWTKPQPLTAQSMALSWLARTSLGRMLADYVSTSYVQGRPVSVFSLAAARVGTQFRQAIAAYRGSR